MALKLYLDRLSQPCRAIEIFLKVNKINYTPVTINLGKGMNRTPEYKKINPFKVVPTIEHNGNLIIESIAILRYLCREYRVDDHWYPKDSLQQARIDEYLEWHHTGTRGKAVHLVWLQVLGPMLLGQTSDEKTIEAARKNTLHMCDNINNIWLKDKPFLNSSKISIADLLATTELEQLALVNYDPKVGRPQLAAWMERVKEQTDPSYTEVHKTLAKFAGAINSKL